MLKKVLIALSVLVLGFLSFVAMQPATYHVERSTHVAAPAEVVFAQLDDFHAWAAWSPWEKLDPGMQKTFEGPERAVGASYAWQGNDQVGKGKMTITERAENAHLAIRLEFIEPFASVADTEFHLDTHGTTATHVTWAMDGHNDFIGKLFCLFVDMDTMIGGDYERGLAALKAVSEAEAKSRAAEAEAARAKAEADARASAQAAAAPAADTAPAP